MSAGHFSSAASGVSYFENHDKNSSIVPTRMGFASKDFDSKIF